MRIRTAAMILFGVVFLGLAAVPARAGFKPAHIAVRTSVETQTLASLSGITADALQSRATPLSREELHALLGEANGAFGQANAAVDNPDRARQLYEQAILLYEKIIGQGQIQNAKLYYNLANAYLLKEDIGRAILNYRRAESLDASDTNIRKNLAFARARRVDTVEVGAETRVLDTLFFWHYDLSIRTRFILACVFFEGLCAGLAAVVWRGRGPVGSTVVTLSAILFLCFLTSVVIETRQRAGAHYGVIIAREVVARQGDGPNYPPSFKDPLHAGTEFKLLERRPGWLHITLSDGSDAWVPDDSAGLI